ncbi:glycosyltransferase [Nitratidesulfovibrio sp. SRB-5]|uniref:glycosyltransferase n=1 Tax=Nitratidesulfovibrio sp. SRB-5 TaxID=2872636 RepID=UPI00102600D8|nr:glycosyltransferase [Nitratidesulfovibrio sp. SRB-5]MBZ2173446.1 glycosyltransferase [Nitratidesulfovibrio sp. SRB-5]RXF75978.1 glycosyltransferase [Desulfovibrio sp. DS-1]
MYYRYLAPGLQTELEALTVDDAIDHLRNHLGNFLLDASVCVSYLNRLAAESGGLQTPRQVTWLRWLIRALARLRPFDEQAVTLAARVNGTPEDTPLIRAMAKVRTPEALHHRVEQTANQPPADAREVLLRLFREIPFCVDMAERLLFLDLQLGLVPGGGWYEGLRCPPLLRDMLDRERFRACMLCGNDAMAMELLDLTRTAGTHDPGWLNCAAELAVRTGDRATGMDYYRASLGLDPMQVPVALRLRELEHPFATPPDALAPAHGPVAVFLYSWNKRDLLEQTLRSLAASDTGGASVTLLLNGCTDGSAEMAAGLNASLFGGRMEIIELPVNVGAPAARNWLLHTPRGREAAFVAFLDDDVEVPADWLSTLVSVLRANPRAGVVGAKTVFPGAPRRLQYLYRNVSVAQPGLLRVSLGTPSFNYDGGTYDVIRPTATVMGCCHVFTRAALDAVRDFDIRFSPSQMDDIAHDLDLCLHGFEVAYCGLVSCVHHQMSGVGIGNVHAARMGNVLGNDVKFYYRFAEHLDALCRLTARHAVPQMPPDA